MAAIAGLTLALSFSLDVSQATAAPLLRSVDAEWAYRRHFNEVYASRGSQCLASQGRRLLRLASGNAQVQQIYRGAAGQIQAAAFSPDGTKIAAADASGHLLIWDQASAKLIDSYHEGHGNFTSLRWSEDGLSLAASNGEDLLLRWQAGYPAESLFSTEDQRILDYWSRHSDETYVLVERNHDSEKRQVMRWRNGIGPAFEVMIHLPDGLSLNESGDTFKPLQAQPAGQSQHMPEFGAIYTEMIQTRKANLNFSPDGRWLSAGTDQRVRLAALEIDTGKLFQAPLNPDQPDQNYTPGEARACFLTDHSLLVFTRHGEDVLVQYSPDHSMPETVFYQELRRWNPVSGRIEPFKFANAEDGSGARPNQDCSLLIESKDQEHGEIWDLGGQKKLLDVPHGNFNATANASQILVEVKDYNSYHSELYARSSGDLLHRFESPDHLLGEPSTGFPWLILQLPQNRPEHEAGEIMLYHQNGEAHRRLPGTIDWSILVSSPDHRYLLLSNSPLRPPEYPPTSQEYSWRYQEIMLLDLASGGQIKLPGRINSDKDRQLPLAFWQHAGEQEVFALSDYALLRWRLRDGRLQQRFDADTAYPLAAVSVSPRQDRLALMDQAGLIQVYRLPDFKRVLRKQLPWGFGG